MAGREVSGSEVARHTPVGVKGRTGRENGLRNPEELLQAWDRVAARRVQGIGGGAEDP